MVAARRQLGPAMAVLALAATPACHRGGDGGSPGTGDGGTATASSGTGATTGSTDAALSVALVRRLDLDDGHAFDVVAARSDGAVLDPAAVTVTSDRGTVDPAVAVDGGAVRVTIHPDATVTGPYRVRVTADLPSGPATAEVTAAVFRTLDERWDQPVLVGRGLDTSGWDDSPAVSPDGRWMVVHAIGLRHECFFLPPDEQASTHPACQTQRGMFEGGRPAFPGDGRVDPVTGAIDHRCPASTPLQAPDQIPWLAWISALYVGERQPDGTYGDVRLLGYVREGTMGTYGDGCQVPTSVQLVERPDGTVDADGIYRGTYDVVFAMDLWLDAGVPKWPYVPGENCPNTDTSVDVYVAEDVDLEADLPVEFGRVEGDAEGCIAWTSTRARRIGGFDADGPESNPQIFTYGGTTFLLYDTEGTSPEHLHLRRLSPGGSPSEGPWGPDETLPLPDPDGRTIPFFDTTEGVLYSMQGSAIVANAALAADLSAFGPTEVVASVDPDAAADRAGAFFVVGEPMLARGADGRRMLTGSVGTVVGPERLDLGPFVVPARP